MRIYGIPATGAALLMGTITAAADGGPAPYQPPYVPIEEWYDWSGIYGGAQGGWLWGQNTAFQFGPLPGAEDDLGPFAYDADGYAVGGVIGLNLQTGRWVYGGELDVEYTNFSGQVDLGDVDFLNKEFHVIGSLRARVGFSLNRVLLYATAGLAVANVGVEAVAGPPLLESISDTQTPFGWTAGAGFQVALGDNWSVGAEYRYSDVGEVDHSGNIFNGEEIFEFTFPHSNQFNAVRARLLYRWGI